MSAAFSSGTAAAHTFLFADLAGYTALTEVHGDEHAADVAAQFERDVSAVVDEHAAEAIKSIGDAVMVRADEPCCAVAVARHLVTQAGARHGALGVRVGMHTGPAAERGGDWFGAAVNIAARVGDVAVAGEVLMTAATRAAAADALVGLDLRVVGPRSFKNVADPVSLYALWVEGERAVSGLPLDPVCRMAVEPAAAASVFAHLGVEHHFCSQDCAVRFRAAPGRYLRDRVA